MASTFLPSSASVGGVHGRQKALPLFCHTKPGHPPRPERTRTVPRAESENQVLTTPSIPHFQPHSGPFMLSPSVPAQAMLEQHPSPASPQLCPCLAMSPLVQSPGRTSQPDLGPAWWSLGCVQPCYRPPQTPSQPQTCLVATSFPGDLDAGPSPAAVPGPILLTLRGESDGGGSCPPGHAITLGSPSVHEQSALAVPWDVGENNTEASPGWTRARKTRS